MKRQIFILSLSIIVLIVIGAIFWCRLERKRHIDIDSQQYPTVNLISDYINPISLLENFDEVWTVSSQMGFEALMLGKKVRCYGTPFYAGYGLTEDMDSNDVLTFRNTYPRTLEEIFYNAYIRYASYFNYNNTAIKWEIEDALEHIKNGIQEVFHR
jgi:capsular polysaccharide export protein